MVTSLTTESDIDALCPSNRHNGPYTERHAAVQSHALDISRSQLDTSGQSTSSSSNSLTKVAQQEIRVDERQTPSPRDRSLAPSPMYGICSGHPPSTPCTSDERAPNGQPLGIPTNLHSQLTSSNGKSNNKATDGPLRSPQHLPTPESKVRAYQSKLRVLQKQIAHATSAHT
jgi:hypothetical protein